jgi:hypothetical protein
MSGGYAPNTGPIDPSKTIYSQNIKDLIASVKWHDEGVEAVSYDEGVLTVTKADGSEPLVIPISDNEASKLLCRYFR